MKKSIARIFALFMSVVLLLAALPAVFAEENKGTLTMGAVESVTMKAGDIFLYTFTPASSGDYMLGCDNSVIQPGISSVSQNGSWGEDLWSYTIYPLEGGVTYTVEINYWDPFNSYPDGCTANVKIVKCDPLAGISLNKTTATGRVGETVDLIATTNPVYINQDDLKWSVDNVSVVSIERDGPVDCSLRLLSPGTVTVTATLGGHSASCVITVEDDSPIPGGTDVWPVQTASQTLTLTPGQTKLYTFTPTETGTYVIYHTYSLFRVSIDGPGSPHQPPFQIATPFGTMNGSFADLIAGETYLIRVELHEFEPEAHTDTVHLEKAQPLQSIALHNVDDRNATAYTGYVSGLMQLYITAEPAYHSAGSVSWSSSDSSVATVDEHGYVNLLAPGTATITVTVDGKTDSCTVTVKDAPVLELDQAASLTFIGSSNVIAQFTPAETGRYKFTILGDGGTCYIEETEYGTYFEGTGTMGGQLTGGQTYLVCLGVGPSAHTIKVERVGDDEQIDNGIPEPTEPEESTDSSDPSQPTEPTDTPPTTQPPVLMDVVLSGDDVLQALESAGEDGIIRIPLGEHAASVQLHPESLQLLVETGRSLELSFADATLTLDSQALATIAEEGAYTVNISIRRVRVTQLNDLQQDSLVAHDVRTVILAEIMKDDDYIHDFGGGQATLQLPFYPMEDEQYVVYYVDDVGQLSTMGVEWSDGWLRFNTGHFSAYVVVNVAGVQRSSSWPMWIAAVAVLVLLAAAAIFWLLAGKKRVMR